MDEFVVGFFTCVVFIAVFFIGGAIHEQGAYRYAYDCITAAQEIDVCQQRLEERMGM